jgi:hypothetical protein
VKSRFVLDVSLRLSPSIFVYLAQEKEFLPASLFNAPLDSSTGQQAYWTLVVPRKQPSNSDLLCRRQDR